MKTIEEAEEAIKALDAEIQRLNDAIHAARVEKRRVEEFLIVQKFKVKPGSIVSYRGAEYRVTTLGKLWGSGKPWLEGNKRLPSGKWHKAAHNIYEWELVSTEGEQPATTPSHAD